MRLVASGQPACAVHECDAQAPGGLLQQGAPISSPYWCTGGGCRAAAALGPLTFANSTLSRSAVMKSVRHPRSCAEELE